MIHHLSPVVYCTHIFGGTSAFARALRVPRDAIWRWTRSRLNMGLIPARHHRNILTLAKSQGLDVKPEDVIYGRDIVMEPTFSQ